MVAVNGTNEYNGSKISTINITIYAKDPVPPVLSPIGNKTLDMFENITFNLFALDWNNDTITYNTTGLPAGAVFNNTTRVFSWTPVAFQSGNYSVTFTATDSGGLNDSETIDISVNKTPPVISAIPDQIFTINSALTLNLSDYVSDLDTLKTDLTWTYSGNSIINVSISEDNNVTFTTDLPYRTGEEIITFTATDPDGFSDSMDVKVIVMFNITLGGSYNTTGNAWDVAVSGSYAYIADYDNGLVVVNISDPANPTLAGSYNTSGYAGGVTISGSYAYIADYNNGLVVVNISNPTNPTLAGSYNTVGNAWNVAVVGIYAYVADGANGLVVVNISNPINPTLVGSYNTAGNAEGVTVSGCYAYIADGANGLVVVNISDPINLTLAGSYNTSGNAVGVAVAGIYAYVADETNGLVVLSNIPSLQLDIKSLSEYSIENTITINYTIINPYHLRVENVSLYYNHGSGWIIYANNSSNTTGSFTFVPPEDGYYEFYCATPVWIEEAPSIVDIHTTVDRNLPDTTLYSYATDPTNNTILYYTGTSVDTVTNIQSVEYRIQQGAWTPASPVDGTFDSLTEDFEFTTPSLADGTYFIEVRASDISDHVELTYASDTITIDSATPPTLVIAYPTPTSITGTTPTLIAATNEPATLKYDFVDVNYTQMNYTFSSTGLTTHTTLLSNLSAGSNTVYVGAADLSGNINNTTANVTWIVDASGPQLSQVLINDQVTDNINSDPNIKTTITSPFSTITAVEYFIDTVGTDGAGIAISPSGTTTQNIDLTLDIAALPDGDHTIYLHAANQMGWGGYQAVVFTIDTTPPVINIVSPQNGTTLVTPAVTIAGTISDASDVALVTVNGETATGTTNWDADVTLINGENNITIVSTDDLGNTQSVVLTVYYNPSAVIISMGAAEVPLNSLVTLPVSIANATNITGISFDLFYNSSVVSVDSIVANNSFTGSSISSNVDNINGTTRVVLTNTNLISSPTQTPVIDVTFNITGDFGSFTNLDLENVELSNSEFNPDSPASVVDGLITVGIKGDLNNNGDVDIGDVAKVAFMVAGKVSEELSADFNENGYVDIGDAAKIAFYLAGKVGEL